MIQNCCHVQLLMACKRAARLLAEGGFVSGLIENEFDATLTQLITAIAKAEERTPECKGGSVK